MASERPEYNSKIRLMIALSPLALMGNLPHPIARLLSVFLPAVYVNNYVIFNFL